MRGRFAGDTTLRSPGWAVLIVAVALLVLLPGAVGLFDPLFDAPTWRLLTSNLLKWVAVGVVVAAVAYGEERPLASIGIARPNRRDLAVGVATLFALLVANVAGQALVAGLGLEVRSDEVLLRWWEQVPLAVLVTVPITAGVTEEVLFRGAAIERLEELTGSTLAGAVLPAVVFVGLHVPTWGLGDAVVQAGLTAVLTLVYLHERRLAPVVFAHVGLDAIGVLIYPAIA